MDAKQDPGEADDVQTETLGQRITARRRELGLSARAAADRAGLAGNTWDAAVKGQRRRSA